MSPSNNSKIKTSLSLSKTKPGKPAKIQRLQQKMSKSAAQEKPTPSKPQRVKPESQIAKDAHIDKWLIPARIAFLLNAFYFFSFSVVSFIGVFSSYKIIRPLFTLPFETSFSSFFLLEIAAIFALLGSLALFQAFRKPRQFSWLYYFFLILFIPYCFASNLLKMQIELPQDFQNYLFFDTIILAVSWLVYLISLKGYLSLKKDSNS